MSELTDDERWQTEIATLKAGVARFQAAKSALHQQQNAEVEDLGKEDQLWGELDISQQKLTDMALLHLPDLLIRLEENERHVAKLRAFVERVGLEIEVALAEGKRDE